MTDSSGEEYGPADVAVGTRCPDSKQIGDSLLAPFLRRGCNRVAPSWPSDTQLKNRFLVGVNPQGQLALARLDDKEKSDVSADDQSALLNQYILTDVPTVAQTNTSHWIPLNTLFGMNRLRDLKRACAGMALNLTDVNVENQEEQGRDAAATKSLIRDGVVLSNPHPLDNVLAFKGHDSNSARQTRFVPWECQPAYDKQQPAKTTTYPYFALPAFGLTPMANPTTYITRIQIIYAALVYLWITSDVLNRREAIRPANTPVPDVEMGTFIAYFPTFLKFHELFRLGTYCHPFDLINEFYNNDRLAHTDYEVQGENWKQKFKGLRGNANSHVAFLSPAMQEGSALAGPFLPIDWTLHELHHHVGLGSIWTIGLPDMPATVISKDASAHFGLYAYPEHWRPELRALSQPLPYAPVVASANTPSPIASGRTTITLSQLSNTWLSISSNLNRTKLAEILGGDATTIPVSHVGAKIGATTIVANPGWTSHLPAADSGLLCSAGWIHVISAVAITPNAITEFAKDQSRLQQKVQAWVYSKFLTVWGRAVAFGTPIVLPSQRTPKSVPWRESMPLKIDPFEARIRGTDGPSQTLATLRRQVAALEEVIATKDSKIAELSQRIETISHPQGDGRLTEGVSSQFMDLSRASLKRKVQEDLFFVDDKRMKPSTLVDLTSLTDPSLDGVTRYLSIAHNEVLRVAATGGLINPMHFDVTRAGTVALSSLGLEQANQIPREP
ncbi:hypothetical protein AK830_g2890 [Neonectria ditissima]|uniref:Uncharacterized protein n=1 Tax=Neonectria ditissima TaxID=78410 RepID=A0A0P7B1B0_9HYPO|nr:hypothetical protein AK830_g2890 [Neonectria ditissima]